MSQPSSTNQRVCQLFGVKSGSPWPARVKEFRKKKAKMTRMEAMMQYQSLRYMDALTVCLRAVRSRMVAPSELSVQT